MGGPSAKPARPRPALVLLALLLLLLLGRDTLGVGPVARIAVDYRFALALWEVRHFPAKWLSWPRTALWRREHSPEERRALVQDYFRLGEEASRWRGEVRRLAALRPASDPQALRRAEAELARVEGERARLRDRVEEVLEAEASHLLAQEGLAYRLGPLSLVWPPVDIRFDRLPKILVTSPRDRILLRDRLLLRGDLTVEQMERLEDAVLRRLNLSAVVDDLGGVATYPALVSTDFGPRHALRTVMHEWVHHYLAFHPLGWAYNADPDMTTLNETVADLVGRELGDRLYQAMGYALPPEPPQGGQSPEGFNFNAVMHQTRLRVEELLSQGKVEEAEAYMEERRRFLAQHGYYIRKLNQAYFAFHGTYAESPASVSPIGSQVEELRAYFPSAGAFLRAVAGVGNYRAFLALLERARQGALTGSDFPQGGASATITASPG